MELWELGNILRNKCLVNMFVLSNELNFEKPCLQLGINSLNDTTRA